MTDLPQSSTRPHATTHNHTPHPASHAKVHHAAPAAPTTGHALASSAGAPKPAPAMAFSDLHLSPVILRAIEQEGYTTPTPIQSQAIPPVLLGRDVLGCAQTGTGKTAAFAMPILHRLLTAPVDKAARGPTLPRALILAPTRELATQIMESFDTYGRHAGLETTTIFGGVSQFHQVRALHRGVDILVATPGRLIDLMNQRLVNLTQVGIFVLDEADRMLDMGFIKPIRRIVSALPAPTEGGRQTLLFSATMPKEVAHLADSLLNNPVKVSVTPPGATVAARIEESVYMIPRSRKLCLLAYMLGRNVNAAGEKHKVERAIVFCRTKHGADKLSKLLNRAGAPSDAIHGNLSQNQRTRTLNNFRTGQTRVLVATDVASRGIDVDGITHVFNFDLPVEPEAYVHRIGRTARAGAAGVAISFCDGEEHDLLRAIERLTKKRIHVEPVPPSLPPIGLSMPPEEPRAFGARGDGRGRPTHHGAPRRDDRAQTRPHAPRPPRAPHAPSGQHAPAPTGDRPRAPRTDGPRPTKGGHASRSPHGPRTRNSSHPSTHRGGDGYVPRNARPQSR